MLKSKPSDLDDAFHVIQNRESFVAERSARASSAPMNSSSLNRKISATGVNLKDTIFNPSDKTVSINTTHIYKRGAQQIRMRQIRTSEIRTKYIRVRQIRMRQIGTIKNGVGQIRMRQICPIQIRMMQIRVGQI